MPILLAQQLTKSYRTGTQEVLALQGVDFELSPGEFVAVIGPSGCGKSTLLNLIGAVEPPTTGEVVIDGQQVSRLSDNERSILRRRRIGFVFQKFNLLPTLNARENVALPLMIDGVASATALAKADAAIASVGMTYRSEHFPTDMSGGEQQRMAIARALVTQPAVILADEPTGALDSTNSQKIVALLRSLTEQGQAVVVVTHDPQVAAQTDRIVRMRDGRVLEITKPDRNGSQAAAAARSEQA